MALTKSDVGHVLALLVDGDELVELREMALEQSQRSALARRLVHRVRSIERQHVIPPCEGLPRVVPVHGSKELSGTHFMSASPLVVARQMGWGCGHRVLLFNFANERVEVRPASEAELFRFVGVRPRRVQRVFEFCGRRSRTRSWTRKWILDRKSEGLIRIWEPEHLTDHPDHANEARRQLAPHEVGAK